MKDDMTDIVEQLDGPMPVFHAEELAIRKKAADEIERLRNESIQIEYRRLDAMREIERLRAVLESLTEDPPATLDEPDADWEVIVKMRAIAREALTGRETDPT